MVSNIVGMWKHNIELILALFTKNSTSYKNYCSLQSEISPYSFILDMSFKNIPDIFFEYI